MSSPDRQANEVLDAFILRAVLDPGSFVKRGRDREGVAFGEPLHAWQTRAVQIAVREVLIDFGEWISEQAVLDVGTVDEAVDMFLERQGRRRAS